MKKKGKRQTAFTASPTATAACIEYLCYFCFCCRVHAPQGRLSPACPFPSGVSTHFLSPTSTSTLPISRSETNGAAILLSFLSFFFFFLHLLRFSLRREPAISRGREQLCELCGSTLSRADSPGLPAPRVGRSLFYSQASNCPSLRSWRRVSSLIFTPLDEGVDSITSLIGKDRKKMQTKLFFCLLGVAYRCPCAATARCPDLARDVSVRTAGRSAQRLHPRWRFGGWPQRGRLSRPAGCTHRLR